MQIVPHNDPFILFDKWFEEAKNSNIKDPTTMALATVGSDNKPSLRMVLLKKFDENGFCFFTNLTSRKGKELATNSNVALCFYWDILGHQIRIEGPVEKVTIKEADDYFLSRKRGSQIGAWASKQSQEIENEKDFEDRIKQITDDFANSEIPRPPFWSGFRVNPTSIEFWEEKEFRYHKRTLYKKSDDGKGWVIKHLYP